MSDSTSERGSDVRQPPAADSWSEFATGVLGALIVALFLSFLGYQAITGRDEPVELHTSVVRIEASPSQYIVHYRVRNAGGETAESVRVLGQIVSDGTTVQQASATLAYVPDSSDRQGTLIFTQDPRSRDLRLRVVSYNVP